MPLAYPNTIVLAVSTKGNLVPFHVPLKPDSSIGLSEVSFVKCEQVMIIVKERLVRKMGTIGEGELQQVGTAVRLVLEVG